MTISQDQIFALLPILVVGFTVVIIMLSIAYQRNQFRHSIVAITGLLVSLCTLINALWDKNGCCYFDQLISINKISSLYMILIIIASLSSIISIHTWLSCHLINNRDEFYLLLLVSIMGGMLLTISNHLIVLFLGMELLSIPLFGLISFSFYKKYSLESSVKYVLLSGISSSFFLFGMAFLYAGTGHLSFMNIKEALLNENNINLISTQFKLLIIMGLGMMTVGFGFKLSCVPFHMWTPDVYQKSPLPVAMYLATTVKIAMMSGFMKFLLVLPNQYNIIFCKCLLYSACCSMLFGSLMVIYQNNINRILAYFSIMNSGYLLMILTTLNNNFDKAQETMIVYLISYLLSSIGVFGIINIIMPGFFCTVKYTNTFILYRGLFWKEPILSIMFTIVMLSLIGMPITLGFIGKFYLLLISINYKLWWFVVFIIISSTISMYVCLKIIINLYLSPLNNKIYDKYQYKISDWNFTAAGLMSITVAVVLIIFGLYPQPIMQLLYYLCVVKL